MTIYRDFCLVCSLSERWTMTLCCCFSLWLDLQMDTVCMTMVWLYCLGFTVTFAALLSKILRVRVGAVLSLSCRGATSRGELHFWSARKAETEMGAGGWGRGSFVRVRALGNLTKVCRAVCARLQAIFAAADSLRMAKVPMSRAMVWVVAAVVVEATILTAFTATSPVTFKRSCLIETDDPETDDLADGIDSDGAGVSSGSSDVSACLSSVGTCTVADAHGRAFVFVLGAFHLCILLVECVICYQVWVDGD